MFSKLSKVAAVLLLGGGAAMATAVPLTPPTDFRATAIDGNNKAKLTWISREPQVRIFAQKRLPNGTWTSLSRYPRNTTNIGKFEIDTPSTHEGSFRFFIKAKRGTSYSKKTPEAYLDNMH